VAVILERMDDKNRRTGRTTRLLQTALCAAREGRQVFFYVHNHAMISAARDMLVRLAVEAGCASVLVGRLGVSGLPGAVAIRALPLDRDKADESLRLNRFGYRPGPVEVFDHLLVELLRHRLRSEED
jgi:hypothetical protein